MHKQQHLGQEISKNYFSDKIVRIFNEFKETIAQVFSKSCSTEASMSADMKSKYEYWNEWSTRIEKYGR